MSGRAPDPGFEALLEFLTRARGLDLTGYKRASLERRFARRMQAVGSGSYGDYLDYLEVHPDEFGRLFDALLINVTSFFRDAPAWRHLREHVLPDLLASRGDGAPVRVWVAGCASGEEAFTVAIVLAELLGEPAYQERVKIYATDIDEEALATARLAAYTAKDLEAVPEELRGRYFEGADDRYSFRADLRRAVIFGNNNLLQDAPISRLDLLVCRNTLMYFTAEAQAKIVRNFHFALRDDGVLVLGKSEMMLSHRDLFEVVELKQRIFRKRPDQRSVQNRIARLADPQTGELPMPEDDREARDAALDVSPQAQVVVARDGRLTFANLAARALFGIAADDVGRPFHELEVCYRPAELRRPLEEALSERRRVDVGEVALPAEGGERRLDIRVTPLLRDGGPAFAAAILFEDVTRYAAARRELEGNRRDLELAYEELQSTIDELETTNEELQSANEELQTTNEELQSTNEELETMNEELQSTNEELETINDELRDRTAELNEVNDFLEAILTSLGVGVAVIDRDQRVQVWNRQAEELWGVRADEAVAHHFLALDIGLPTERLAPALRAALSGTEPRTRLELDAVNRRGRAVTVLTTVMPLLSHDGDGQRARGAIVLMTVPEPPDGGDGATG